MARKNKLLETPPYAVEQALKHLGANLRTARLRRNLTIQDVAEKIGTGPRAVGDAEKGKLVLMSPCCGLLIFCPSLNLSPILRRTRKA